MCRITEHPTDYSHFRHLHLVKHRLRLTDFAINLSFSSISSSAFLPEILTLVFLPRVHVTRLKINGSKIRPDSPAFISLHRAISQEIAFSCRDQIVVSDGAAFEVHVGDMRLLKGVFREDDDEWRMECKCLIEKREYPGLNGIEVCARESGGSVMRQNVAAVKWKSNKKNGNGFKTCLNSIPEGIEDGVVEGEEEEDKYETETVEDEEEEDKYEMEMETVEGERWAVDLGIWVACFGVGFLVSTVSARSSFFRRKLFV